MFLACPALWRTVIDEGGSESLAMTTMERQNLEEGDTLLPVWQALGRSVVEEGAQASHSRGGAVSMAWHPRAYLVLWRPSMELGGCNFLAWLQGVFRPAVASHKQEGTAFPVWLLKA